MQRFKYIVISVVIGFALAGSVTYAANWQSPNWISNGASISATKLKAHFTYLKNKVDTLSASGGSSISKNGSSLYYNSGNFGIGTASPSNKLEVAGKIEADYYCNRSGAKCRSANTGIGALTEYAVETTYHSQVAMGTHAFCALTKQRVWDNAYYRNRSTQHEGCDIVRSGSSWTLHAYVSRNNVGRAYCKATCF
jgi:hypothetical protein